MTDRGQASRPPLAMIPGIIVGVAVFGVFAYFEPGPEWAWSGCMDPGPGVSGCAMVYPVGMFVAVVVSVLAASVVVRWRSKNNRKQEDG